MEGSAVSAEAHEPGAAAAASAVVTIAPVPTAAVAAPATVPAAASAGHSALVRAQAAVTELAPRLQYQLTRVGPAGQAGLGALVAAVIFAVSTLVPARHVLDSLSADLARVQHPSTVLSPDQAVPRLVESLPTRAQIPAVIGVIYAQAVKSGVALDIGHYNYSPAKSGALARYDVEFPVKAGYPQIRGFINDTLTAVPAAALDKLHVERKTVGDPTVNASIGFVIFVRSE
jgi:hypothetical protein